MAESIADLLEVPQMIRSLRIAVLVGMLAALVIGTGTVAADSGKGHNKVFDARLIGLAVKGTVVAGVTGAGHAWSIEEGNAKLFANGRVIVNTEGLVLSPEGTQPVANGEVIISCNGGGDGNVLHSLPVPLSPEGDAHFNGMVNLIGASTVPVPMPSPCNDPVIFFGSLAGTWFAVTE